jgi:predicted RNase H-like nuclease (RuvC/YqgF family)
MFKFLVVNFDALAELNAEGIEADETNMEDWLISSHKTYEAAENALEKLENKFPNMTCDIMDIAEV